MKADPIAHYHVAKYLNDRRKHIALVAFARRAGTVTVIAVAFVSLMMGVGAFIARRRRAMEGRCRMCGYDLRASIDPCPERGTAFASDLGVARLTKPL